MIIYLHGFNSSSSSSKAQLCKKYLNDKGIGDKILIPDLPLSTDKVVNLIEILIPENEIVGFIGSSMGGFYSCYFANKYNVKGVYINPVVEDHLTGMVDIVGSYENFNNGKKDTFSMSDYKNLKKYSTPTLKFPKNHFLLAQEGKVSFWSNEKCSGTLVITKISARLTPNLNSLNLPAGKIKSLKKGS